MGGAAIAHNGNLTNADSLDVNLLSGGLFFKVPPILSVLFI